MSFTDDVNMWGADYITVVIRCWFEAKGYKLVFWSQNTPNMFYQLCNLKGSISYFTNKQILPFARHVPPAAIRPYYWGKGEARGDT